MDQRKCDQIYERLRTFSIDLPRGSSDLGPDFLREAISVCRNYLNETSHYLQDILVEESYLALKLDAEESAYQIRAGELLATDSRVSLGPAIADRQAVIDTILRDQKQSIVRLQSGLLGLSHVKTVVRARQTELNNTMSSIRLQRSLLKDALRTGSFYGDESSVARGHGGLDPVDELGSIDLEALITASEAELDLEAAAVAKPALLAAPEPAPFGTSRDPADDLDSSALEALMNGVQPSPAIVSGDSDESSSDQSSSDDPSPDASTSDEALHAALERFLEEPDEDIASILENL